MAEAINARQFHDSDGIEDWRVLAHGACAHFRTDSFAAGVALVDAVGKLADEMDHHPDIDLRYGSVTIRLTTHSLGGLSDLDLTLARKISETARELGVAPDPTAVQDVELTIDASDRTKVMPFWQAVLGYDPVGDEDMFDPHRRWPGLWFQPMAEPRTERNRIHVDLFVPHDQAEARVAAALAAGGQLLRDRGPTWWTLADPEGNEVDVATCMGRD